MIRKKFLIMVWLIFCIFAMCTVANANIKNSNKIISGDYQYSSSLAEVQLQNIFEYRDDCFTRSSYLGCKHLESLSIQVAASSISFYSQEPDNYEIATEDNAHNVIDFLDKMEFEDIETNKYYKTEKHENSVGVCVGHKTIIQSGDSYTLLAIVPRSAGYKQEWAGNFTIGDGDIHEGFKAARDEILRFVKQYINKNDIEGKLKVWISGYSRGAAISDMLGGFFAGGGIDYFGDAVSIIPEDVYCYTIGTPRTIKDGLDKNIELSVSASRDEVEYKDDTEGEEFIYTKGGKVEVGDTIYGGLKNLISSADSFPLLPPEEWGFTHYGNRVDPTEGLSSIDDALKELKSISEYVYDIYTEDGALKKLKLKTFDLKTLSIVDKGEEVNPAVFMKEKVDGLAHRIGSSKNFHDEHYQDGLKSFVGAYGLLATVLNDAISDSEISTGDAIKTLLYTYVAYASEILQEEGVVDDYKEATMIVIKDLLEHFLEIDVDVKEFTIDDLFFNVTKYIADNIDEPVGQAAISGIASSIPENYKGLIIQMFGKFHKNYYIDADTEEINEDLTNEEVLAEFIKACAYGADPDCPYAGSYDDPKEVREILYMLVAMATNTDYPEIPLFLFSENSAENGHGLLKDAVNLFMGALLVDKDESGEIINEYEDISELADEALLKLLTPVLEESVEKCKDIYDEDYCDALESEINELKNNITTARKAISTLMFYKTGEYNTIESLEGTLSFVSDAMTVVVAHFDEVYLAYSRMSNRYEDHFAIEEGEIYHEVLFELNKGKFTNGFENPLNVIDGTCVDRPENPTRSGYRFKGWFADEKLSIEFNFDLPITEDVIIYAKWNKKVTGSGSSFKSQPIIQENTIKNDTVEKEIINDKAESSGDVVIWSQASEWATEELIKADEKNLIPTSFVNKDFTKPITRSEFAAVAVKLYESITGETAQIASVNPFIDTDDEYVLKAYNLGITVGISDNEFGDGEITREQMAVMITRTLSKAGIDVSVDIEEIERFLDDKQMHDWGKMAVYFMSNVGIIKGVGNNFFNALGNASIEQSLLISIRSIEVFGK